MANHICSCPGCYNSENDGTMYSEELEHENGTMTVCGKHLSKRRIEEGRVEVIDGPDKAAMGANALTLAGLEK